LIERSQMTRYDFGAIAAVVDLNSREDMIVVTRDLSFAGCFVKTRNPFPAGTEVRVRITYSGSDFAAIGKVTGYITPEGSGHYRRMAHVRECARPSWEPGAAR
jgi:hypothetical protein